MLSARRIRGTVVSGVIWALVGAAAGIGLGLVFVTPHPPLGAEGPPGIQIVARFGVLFATLGATAGVLFAAAVVLLNRIRPRAQLAPWVAAVLGALASAAATLPVSDRIGNLISIAALGAALAGGSVSIAQRSRRQTRGSHSEVAT
jgi:hypothetical protein